MLLPPTPLAATSPFRASSLLSSVSTVLVRKNKTNIVGQRNACYKEPLPLVTVGQFWLQILGNGTCYLTLIELETQKDSTGYKYCRTVLVI